MDPTPAFAGIITLFLLVVLNFSVSFVEPGSLVTLQLALNSLCGLELLIFLTLLRGLQGFVTSIGYVLCLLF